jgi:hypothetical protein
MHARPSFDGERKRKKKKCREGKVKRMVYGK